MPIAANIQKDFRNGITVVIPMAKATMLVNDVTVMDIPANANKILVDIQQEWSIMISLTSRNFASLHLILEQTLLFA